MIINILGIICVGVVVLFVIYFFGVIQVQALQKIVIREAGINEQLVKITEEIISILRENISLLKLNPKIGKTVSVSKSYVDLIVLHPFMGKFLTEEEFSRPETSVVIDCPNEYFDTITACSSTEASWLDVDGNILAQAGSITGIRLCKEALDNFVSAGGDRSRAKYLLHISKVVDDWKVVLYELEKIK
jgi:hypothetical protein